MSLKKGFTYVFLSNMLGLLISIITGFVLPKMLSIDSYSSIKLFQLYIAYIGILHLGFSDGMYLKYGGKEIGNISETEIKSEFKTFKIFQFVVTVFCVFISLIFKNSILFYCSLSILPINVGNYLRNLYQATGKFDQYAKFTNLSTLFTFFVNFFLLFIIKTDNANYYIVGYIFFYFVYWVLLELEISRLFGKEKSNFSFQYLKDNIREGFFLMLGNFSNVIFTSLDRLLVKYFLGIAHFAYYSFAVSLENLMNTIINPVSVIMYNYLCKNKKKSDILFLKRAMLIFSILLISVVYPIKLIIEIWLTKYQEATNVIFLLFASQIFSILVRSIHTNLYKANKKQNQYFLVMGFIILFSIGMNFLCYSLSKTIESFAIATLSTNILWFFIGEYHFKEYRLKLSDYSCILCLCILFLTTGYFCNATYGGILYVVVAILVVLLFMRSTMKTCFIEIKNFLSLKRK